MKENSPICASDAEMVSAAPTGRLSAITRKKPRTLLPTRMMNSVQDLERVGDEDAGVEQHADRDEEQHGEGIAERQALLRRTIGELAFGQDHAGKERAER